LKELTEAFFMFLRDGWWIIKLYGGEENFGMEFGFLATTDELSEIDM
jgi:hypothetical protein